VINERPQRYVELERFDVRAMKAVQLEMLKQLFRRYGVPYSASEGAVAEMSKSASYVVMKTHA